MPDIPQWDLAYERSLILRCQAGDKSAFEPVVRNYMRRAYFIALGFVGDKESAEDLSQDAFVNAYRNIKSFNPDLPLFPWLYRILKNLCLNHIRGKKRRAEDSIERLKDSGFDIECDTENPQAQIADQEMKLALWQSIYKLGEPDREIILLRHIEEFSYEEIAALQDVPKGTVMSRLFRAREKLKELMDGYF